MMPGLINPAFLANSGGFAAYCFDATNKRMTRSIAAGPASSLTFTVSLWANMSVDPGAYATVFKASGNSRSTICGRMSDGRLDAYWVYLMPVVTKTSNASVFPTDGTWHHYVYAFDTTAASAGDRIKLYKDGALLSATDDGTFNQNEDTRAFAAGGTLYLGNGSNYGAKKLAFVDVVVGTAQTPADFAFDDGGVWTRKKYAGSYGSYGLAFDGSDGFSDVSGNSLDMTPENMTGADLDTYDLPPYTN